MQTFRQLFRQMTCDAAFNALYEKECNVCPFTVRIFEKIGNEKIDTAAICEILDIQPNAVDELRDADCCDPKLVIRLCHHLDLEAPKTCPKLVNPAKDE